MPAAVSGCAVEVQMWAVFAFSACSPIAHACGFYFNSGRATIECARASVSARTMRSQMTPLSFGIRSLWDVSSSARTVPPQMSAGFAGVVHVVRPCVGGFQFHCASFATVAAGVSFSAQSVANAASFGFREFRRSHHECEQASSYSFSAHNPGVDVNRFRCQQMHFAAQMCVRSRCKSCKIRFRRTVPLQIQRTRLGE